MKDTEGLVHEYEHHVKDVLCLVKIHTKQRREKSSVFGQQATLHFVGNSEITRRDDATWFCMIVCIPKS